MPVPDLKFSWHGDRMFQDHLINPESEEDQPGAVFRCRVISGSCDSKRRRPREPSTVSNVHSRTFTDRSPPAHMLEAWIFYPQIRAYRARYYCSTRVPPTYLLLSRYLVWETTKGSKREKLSKAFTADRLNCPGPSLLL